MSFISLRPAAVRVTLGLAAIAVATLATLEGQTQLPLTVQPSGRATTEVVLVPAEQAEGERPAQRAVIRIDYGQPHLRGRQLHTADLVPYDQPWRLGANAATKLMTEVDLVIGGAAIPKGTYVLRALPGRDAWKLLVEKNEGQSPMGPAQGDKPAEVVARIDLEQMTLQAPLESLSMWLIPSTEEGPARGELRFAWGTTQLSTSWSAK